MNQIPYVLSIAGFDPSGGAGVLADVKTFEAHKVFGLGVVSALTYQHESHFASVNWVAFDEIAKQIEVLAQKYRIGFVKIGLIESGECLQQLVNLLKSFWPDCFIIWDPILKASSGFDFHESAGLEIAQLVKGKINLITPNIPEYEFLFGTEQAQAIVNDLECAILVKGGHSDKDVVCDQLYQMNKDCVSVVSKKVEGDWQKHGTGCVLSAAICAHLANGYDLKKACTNAHFYVKKFIASHESLLGFHG